MMTRWYKRKSNWGLLALLSFYLPVMSSQLQASDLKSRLDQAYTDEVQAERFYEAVIERFGPIRPFIRIIEAERRHQSALLSLYQKYNLSVPSSIESKLPKFDSVKQACEIAVKAEIENDELFATLLESTSEPDVQEVFRNLAEASREKHLPAFRRCVRRES